MKNEFDKVDGALGYSFLGMGLFLFLQLMTTCGLCCNKDRNICCKRKDEQKPAYNEFTDLQNQSSTNINNSKAPI